MNEILKIEPYSEKTARVRILNPVIAAKYEPGHFVIVKFRTDGHRIPFSIIDANREEGSIDIIIHRADGLDEILSMIEVGESLPDLLGPLGHPAVIEPESRILFFGDGAGVVPLLPLIRAAKEKGCKVKAVLSEQSSRTQCLLNEIQRDCDAVVTVSDDNMLESAINFVATEPIDKVLMSGPTLMMKRLANETKERGIPAECILNMLMIDGIGLCGICRVIVGGERKQTCTDGPIFDAHQVDFDQMFNRQRLFV
jgi:NAD(P)H-flavin reductase